MIDMDGCRKGSLVESPPVGGLFEGWALKVWGLKGFCGALRV